MLVYFLLLSLTAFVAYTVASVGTLRFAGLFVFRRDLNRLGTGNVWFSNFRRLYGIGGLVKLLLVEVVKALLPILLGGLLLSLKGKADAGRAFAGFCVMMGRLWPVFNRFRGCHGCVALAVVGLMIEPSVGVAAAAVSLAAIAGTRYLSLGAVLGALIMAITSVLVVEDRLCMLLLIGAALLVLARHLPALRRIAKGTEERFSLKTDLTYKLDSKF